MFLFALMATMSAFAQTVDPEKKEMRRIRVETNLGMQMQLFRVGAVLNQPGYSFGLEGRYLLPCSPWDIGIGSRVAAFKRYYEEAIPLFVSSQHYLAADYNYRICGSFNLFGGLELGFSVAYDLSEYNKTRNRYQIQGVLVPESQYIYTGKSLSPYIAPRIGFEAWNRLRVTLSAGFMDKGYSNISLRAGVLF